MVTHASEMSLAKHKGRPNSYRWQDEKNGCFNKHISAPPPQQKTARMKLKFKKHSLVLVHNAQLVELLNVTHYQLYLLCLQ